MTWSLVQLNVVDTFHLEGMASSFAAVSTSGSGTGILFKLGSL